MLRLRFCGTTPSAERWARAAAQERGRRCTVFSDLLCGSEGGPRLHILDGQHIAPDLLAVRPRSGHGVLVELQWCALCTWQSAFQRADHGADFKAHVADGLRCWIAFLFARPTSDRDAPEAASDGFRAGSDKGSCGTRSMGRSIVLRWLGKGGPRCTTRHCGRRCLGAPVRRFGA
jgi:hypothetical protein